MKNIVIDVTSRAELGKNVSRRLRRAGSIPAVVYGENKASVPVAVDPRAIQSILGSETGENTLFRLRLDGQDAKTRHVMMRERQRDPVSGELLHVDFVRVVLAKKMEVEVPVSIVGVADGVKNDGGLMDFVVRSVHVRCLPADIPDRMQVDVQPMSIGDVFRVKDLTLKGDVELLTDPEQALVVISAPAKEEEPAAVAEEAVAEPGAAEAEATPKEKTEAAPGEKEPAQ